LVLVAQGDEAQLIPLIQDIRELEGSRHPAHAHLRQRLPQLHTEIRRLAADIGQVLPPALGDSQHSSLPSWWETYRDTFARFCIAPGVINGEIACSVAEAYHPDEVWMIWPSSAGPCVLQDVRLAVRSVLEATGVRLRVETPGLPKWPIFWPLRDRAAGIRSLWQVRRKRRAQRTQAPPQADVCCLAVGATSAPIIARLAEALAAQHGLSLLPVDIDFAGSRQALVKHHLDFVEPLALAPVSAYTEAWRRQLALLFSSRTVAANAWPPGLPERYKATLHRPLHSAIVRNAAIGLYRIHCAQALLNLVRPKVLLAFHPYADIISPYVLAAKRQGVKCLYLQHGILGPFTRTIGSLPYDKMMVFGDYVKNLFEGWVDSEAEVVVTGHCLYDEAVRNTEVNEQLRPELLGDRDYLVLVATQPDEPQVKTSQEQWWLRGLAEACRELDARAVLKLHPQETDAGAYRELAQAFPDHVTVLPHATHPLGDLIDAGDVVVMRDSTVAYEANLRGRLVITINLSTLTDRYPVAETGGALGVWKYGDILPTLRQALTDEATQQRMAAQREDFLRLHLGPLDSHATERICQHIAHAVAEADTVPSA